MNHSAPDDAQIEILLRKPLAPLSADDFTARVLAALPPARSMPDPAPRRMIFVGAGAIAGVAFAGVRLGSWSKVAQEWPTLQAAFAQLAIAFGDQQMLLGLAITSASLLGALLLTHPLRLPLSFPRWH
ncbi:MAG: hypothetical protein RLZZ15_2520 [Verrucomicrobiota bacterium]|jgi:hypothetical protein